MFRRFSILLLSLCSVVSVLGTVFVLPAQAEDVQTRIGAGLEAAAAGGYANTQTDPAVIVSRLVDIALGIFGALLFIYMIYGGVLWMTSGGDSKKVDKARDMIKNAIIGIAIITFAYTITTYVLGKLGDVTKIS